MPAVQLLRLHSAQEAKGLINTNSLKQLLQTAFNLTAFPFKYINSIWNDGECWYVMVDSNKEVIAAATLRQKDHSLWNFAVHSAYQRKGLGRMLLHYIRQEVPGLHWWVDKNNTAAISFYRKCGASAPSQHDPRNCRPASDQVAFHF